MEHAIAFMMGVSYLAIGLSYLFHRSDWAAWFKFISMHDRNASLSLGMINILLGTMILGFHWKWAGLPLVLTIMGFVTTLKGIVYLLCLSWLPTKLRWLESNYRLAIPIAGLVSFIMGGVMLCEWCTSITVHQPLATHTSTF